MSAKNEVLDKEIKGMNSKKIYARHFITICDFEIVLKSFLKILNEIRKIILKFSQFLSFFFAKLP